LKTLKDKEYNEEHNPNATFYVDTTYKTRLKNCLDWEEIYEFLEAGNFEDEYESDEDDFKDIKRSSLHKVATRPTILPYYDMVHWIISHIDIKTCTIVNHAQQVVGSFRPDDIVNMYKLDTSEVCLDRKILQQFEENKLKVKKREMDELIKNWCYDPNSFKIRLNKLIQFKCSKGHI
jgi:hypothetical protein